MRKQGIKGWAVALGAILTVSSTPATALTAFAAGGSASATPADDRNVMLGTSGLSDPSNPFGDDWVGNFVYFGNVGNYPICFRVLDTDSTDFGGSSLLLDANYGVLRKVYDANGNAGWETSDIRSYLNDEFLMGNFSEAERNAIKTSTNATLSGDKVFLLSADEVKNADYGYAEGSSLFKENMKVDVNLVPWMLRSTDGSVSYVDASGYITSGDASSLTYITPAVNLSQDNILFTYPAEAQKPAWLAPTYEATDAYLKLTVKGGEGFSASRKDGDSSDVPAGYGFLVDVTNIGSAEKGVNYSQISGLLRDANGNVAAYGLLSDVAATGEVLATIPTSVAAGDYTLCVFAEDVESDHFDHATDYASNFAEIPVRVTDPGLIDAGTQDSAEASKTQQVQKTEAKKSGKTASESAAAQTTPAQQQKKETQTAPQAVAHTVKTESGGNGKVTSSVDKAKVGTVVTLLAVPDNGYHFKEWQSGQVSVASDNRFTMPDQDVTVKAIFEKNNDKHAIIFDRMENGTVTVSTTSARKDEEITVQANPSGGYHFSKWETSGISINNDYKVTFRMPDNDIHIRAIFEKDQAKKYKVDIRATGGGRAWADVSSEYANNWVKLAASPDNGYRFVRWDSNQVNPGGQNKFLMPAKDVTVTAVFEKIPESSYAVSTTVRGDSGRLWLTDESGSSRTAFKKGEKVVIRYDMDKDTKLESLRAENVDLTTDSRTGAQYFYMPAKDVSVTAVFSKQEKASYNVSTSVSGSGSAFTGDANSNPKSSFNEGETVWIWWSTQTEVDGVTTSSGDAVSQDSATRAYTFTMPAHSVTVYAKFKDPTPQTYTVSVYQDGNGTATLENGNKTGSFKAGDTVTVKWKSDVATVDWIDVQGVSDSRATTNDSKQGTVSFIMPAQAVSVTVYFKAVQQAHAVTTYANGNAWTTDINGQYSTSFLTGETVQIVRGTDMQAPTSVTVDGGVTVTKSGDIYTFVMPDRDVAVTVVFPEPEPEPVPAPAVVNNEAVSYTNYDDTGYAVDDGGVDDTVSEGEVVE